MALDWSVDAALVDGAAITIRPLQPSDRVAVLAFFTSLSPETIRLRFFSPGHRTSDAELTALTSSDASSHLHLGAFHADALVGIGDYYATTADDEAEVGFAVSDAFQGHGVGSLLLEYLAETARAVGICRFIADTLVENFRMLDVFRHVGLIERVGTAQDGIVSVTLDITETAGLHAASGERARLATVAAVQHLFTPRGIAVVGAGRTPGGIGNTVLRNLLGGPFNGRIYPVNPAADNVCGVPAYANVSDVPGKVDLAVIAVPGDRVAAIVEDCGRSGVASLVIISAGFAETGAKGSAEESHVLAVARRYGMRLVGPNCMGIMSTDSGVRLNATFAPTQPPVGNVGFFTQSGALGLAVLDEARRRGIGLSSFVSAGNKADISGNDLLQYWEQDPRTDVVLLYLESFGNPQRFGEIARRISRRKPIVAVKGGRSRAGARAAASHTAALSSPDTSVDALFRQAGVIRVARLEQLFDVGLVLAGSPLPPGNRVAVVGNAGGAGILTADACEAAGLTLPELSDETVTRLRAALPPAAALRNPVDMTAMAGPAEYAAALEAVLSDASIDSVIGIFVPVTAEAGEIQATIEGTATDAGKPVLLTLLGGQDRRRHNPSRLPVFAFPESAAYALGAVTEYAAWRRRDPGVVKMPSEIDLAAARGIVAEALAGSPAGCQLAPLQADALMRAVGVPVVATSRIESAEAAVAAAVAIGYPVALKAAAAALIHKSDRGGVAIDIRSAGALRRAYQNMKARLGSDMGGALVQAMAPAGIETIVGVVRDPSFGMLVVFGSGGTAVGLIGDQAFRAAPLTDVDVRELIREPRGSALLFGYRGSPPCDVNALAGIIERVSALVTALPEIAEMDLNPVIVGASGAVAVDVKVRLEPQLPDPLAAARRLRRPSPGRAP